MAPAIGNQWWKLRAKHGRDKIFKTPDDLWQAATEYFEATDARKWVKKDWVGKDANEVERETETPYTITGLCLFLDVGVNYWHQFKKEAGDNFSLIIARIDAIIHTQKMEGAMVGAFNANIVARDLGLVDKSEQKGTMISHNVTVTREEASEIAKGIENDI